MIIPSAVEKLSYGAAIVVAVPVRRGARPVTCMDMSWCAMRKKAESTSVESTMLPTPVSARRCRADMIPIAAHIPVVTSTSEAETRAGGPSGWPLASMMPLKAWTTGSYPGRSCPRGPLPNEEIEQYTSGAWRTSADASASPSGRAEERASG
jgi:hypothetical protein